MIAPIVAAQLADCQSVHALPKLAEGCSRTRSPTRVLEDALQGRVVMTSYQEWIAFGASDFLSPPRCERAPCPNDEVIGLINGSSPRHNVECRSGNNLFGRMRRDVIVALFVEGKKGAS